MASVSFVKMHGCGNDFVFVDNRELAVPQSAMADWARAICPRAVSVGADGLIFIEEGDSADMAYRWNFYNADGSRAEMCGNASRCMGSLAVRMGLADKEHTFGTDAGPIRAQVLDDGRVKVQLTPYTDLRTGFSLDLDGADWEAHFANTGVPHTVLIHDDVSTLDVKKLGAAVRYHDAFAPAGTNANFITVKDKENLALRTYERGVEGETLACGTGAAASAVVTHSLGLTGPSVRLVTTGGEVLGIDIEDETVYLIGEAVTVYTGVLETATFGL